MIEELPTAKTLVVQLATLPVTGCAAQPVMLVAPDRKLILPVGVTPPIKVAVKVTLVPTVVVPLPVTAKLGAAWLTVCVTAGEVAAALLMSPAYTAVIDALPTGSALVVQVATLLATACAAQPVMLVAPDLKLILPVGVKPLLKVAVKVTLVPTVVVPLPLTAKLGAAWLTVCVTAGEVAAALLMSPAYTAVIDALPTGSALVVQVATLLPTGCAAQPVMLVPPALKATLPVGEIPPLKVAVKVTLAPTVDDPFPVTATATSAGGAEQVRPVMINEKRLSVPVSVPAVSATFSVQLPLAFCPSNADNALSGAKLPATAPVDGIVDTGGNALSSSSKIVQKLAPLPPRLVIKLTVVPDGEVNLNRRSPRKVCVTDALVLSALRCNLGGNQTGNSGR